MSHSDALIGSGCGTRFEIEQESVAMLPVQRISKSRKRKRRSHHALKPIQYVRCAQCGNAKLPHAACGNCGFVNPKLAVDVATDAE